ncbi:NUDIX hydrolase [Mangrovicoccus ximenensis]|uniref:NUDIX hydrolase n=1 Tax=Mangrovicoccus ximenensis TaxID=1911570 RepID=UPI00137514B4
MIHSLVRDFLGPILRRPPRFQSAALCWRDGTRGCEILLLTSRETKRWVLPKGWPKRGLDAGGTAAEEAWEEAGMVPRPGKPFEIGRYSYMKRLDGGLPVPVEVSVFSMEVERLAGEYPELGQRERRWFTPAEAAEAVDEPGLKTILRRFRPPRSPRRPLARQACCAAPAASVHRGEAEDVMAVGAARFPGGRPTAVAGPRRCGRIPWSRGAVPGPVSPAEACAGSSVNRHPLGVVGRGHSRPALPRLGMGSARWAPEDAAADTGNPGRSGARRAAAGLTAARRPAGRSGREVLRSFSGECDGFAIVPGEERDPRRKRQNLGPDRLLPQSGHCVRGRPGGLLELRQIPAAAVRRPGLEGLEFRVELQLAHERKVLRSRHARALHQVDQFGCDVGGPGVRTGLVAVPRLDIERNGFRLRTRCRLGQRKHGQHKSGRDRGPGKTDARQKLHGPQMRIPACGSRSPAHRPVKNGLATDGSRLARTSVRPLPSMNHSGSPSAPEIWRLPPTCLAGRGDAHEAGPEAAFPASCARLLRGRGEMQGGETGAGGAPDLSGGSQADRARAWARH